MEAEIKRQFAQVGVDPEDAINRFLGKEELYQKFLKKYPDDTEIDTIRQGFKNKDAFEVFRAGHTLKGIAANLGLEGIQNRASEITEYTRGKSFDQVDASELGIMITELESYYKEVCKVIEMYCQ